jgi:cysteine-rich repeat protein
VRPVPPLTRYGIPKNRIVCYEGDSTCDIDSDIFNHTCTFAVRLCINNADPRLPTCLSSALQSIEVRRPRWGSRDAADQANLLALENVGGSSGFGLPIYRGKQLAAVGLPNTNPNLCSDPQPLLVPLRQGARGRWRDGRRPIALRVVSTSADKDTDTLTLLCRTSTCGNHIIETDHEQCDDGNRNNGDGCSQACKIE